MKSKAFHSQLLKLSRLVATATNGRPSRCTVRAATEHQLLLAEVNQHDSDVEDPYVVFATTEEAITALHYCAFLGANVRFPEKPWRGCTLFVERVIGQ